MAIESELEVLKSVVNKLDSSLEKISEVSNSIGRLLAVHDERIDQLEKVAERRTDDIKELHARISTQTREIVEKIQGVEKNIEDKMSEQSKNSKEQHEKIQREIAVDVSKIDERLIIIERWRWYVLGAVAAIFYVSGSHFDIFKFLK